MSVRDNPDLIIAAILVREDPRDVFVAITSPSLKDLPKNAVIGTSSPRRECQLKRLRPDCHIKNIGGNLGTRLAKLEGGDYNAIILVAAGLKRLQLENYINGYFDSHEFIPAIGQGAIGVACVDGDSEAQSLMEKPLHHRETQLCVTAERAVNYESVLLIMN